MLLSMKKNGYTIQTLIKSRSLNCFDTSDIILVHDMGKQQPYFLK